MRARGQRIFYGVQTVAAPGNHVAVDKHLIEDQTNLARRLHVHIQADERGTIGVELEQPRMHCGQCARARRMLIHRGDAPCLFEQAALHLGKFDAAIGTQKEDIVVERGTPIGHLGPRIRGGSECDIQIPHRLHRHKHRVGKRGDAARQVVGIRQRFQLEPLALAPVEIENFRIHPLPGLLIGPAQFRRVFKGRNSVATGREQYRSLRVQHFKVQKRRI